MCTTFSLATCGLYYKCFMIVNYALVWSITYDHNLRSLQRLALASLSCDCSFIVLATVITIVNYDCKTFTVPATGVYV